MLGTYLVRHLNDISSRLDNSENLELFSASRNGNDFYCDFSITKTMETILNEINPDVVVNCVAITSLEYCERNPEECLKINGYAPGYLAEICKEKNSRLIQVSTDHFYEDDGPKAHKENDKTFFLNEYAKSKLIAESEITKRGRNFLILRTSIIGLTKEQRSYLDWILENINHSREAGLYFNAYTSLIHCKQLSRIILELAQNKHLSGLYNISNKNVFSKGDLYLRVAKRFGVEPIYKKEDLNSQLLKRSISCGLSPSKIESTSGLSMPSLEDLVECIFHEQQQTTNE